jgi:hypothetical protein
MHGDGHGLFLLVPQKARGSRRKPPIVPRSLPSRNIGTASHAVLIKQSVRYP